MQRIHLHIGKVPIKGPLNNIPHSQSKSCKMKQAKTQTPNHNNKNQQSENLKPLENKVRTSQHQCKFVYQKCFYVCFSISSLILCLLFKHSTSTHLAWKQSSAEGESFSLSLVVFWVFFVFFCFFKSHGGIVTQRICDTTDDYVTSQPDQ